MKSFFSAHLVAAGALAVAALGATSVAHARSDVYFSIGVHGAPVYVEPAPVYVQPRPVYVQPQPVYVQPQPVYVQSRTVYLQPGVYSAQEVYGRPAAPPYAYSYEEERAWRRAEWQRRHWRHHHHHWDDYQR
jgi:hypothetical protein